MVAGTAAALMASPGIAVAQTSAHITSVKTSGTSAKPEITVTGRGFGRRPTPNPPHFATASKAMGCPVVPAAKAGHLYGTQLYFTDLKAKKGTYTNWTAGQFTPGGSGFFDCVGLVIDQWGHTKVRFHFGATYGKPFPQNKYFLSNGDRFKVFVRHATSVRKAKLGLMTASGAAALMASSGIAVAQTSAHIASVKTSGTSAKPEITVTGRGFGQRPTPNPSNFATASKGMGCPVVPAAKAGHLYGTQLYFTDLKAKKGTYTNWTGGQYNSRFFDCIGVVIDQWSHTKVRFHFGATYGKFFPNNTYFLTNGDRFKVFVRHATLRGTAKLG